MTFEKFKTKFMKFLQSSTVNLGRRNAKTRQAFLDEALARFDAFITLSKESKREDDSIEDRVLCIKPKDRRKALDIGHGVHAMTPTESARADEQLNRSPYTGRSGKE